MGVLRALPLLLLLSGVDCFVGLLSSRIALAVAAERRLLLSAVGPEYVGRGRNQRSLHCCDYCPQADDNQVAHGRAEDLCVSLGSSERGHEDAPTAASRAKGIVARMCLAALLAPAVYIGGVALPPSLSPVGGAGLVAPVFAELEPLQLKSYSEEFSSGLAPVNTVRGVWRTRETRSDGSAFPKDEGKLTKKGICKGRLSFKGFVGAQKGTVEYKGCGDREGKGRWLTKPKNIVNGRITLSARWKINFADGTSLLYRGDVVKDSEEGTPLRVEAGGAVAARGADGFERPDAHIRGEVLRPITSVQGTLTEKKIGEFEADLIELPSDSDNL